MRKLWILSLVLSVTPLTTIQATAQNRLRATLFKAADLPQNLRDDLAPTGTDPLDSGQIRVEERTIRVEVRGAVADAEYRLMFCQLGPAPRSCDGIGNFVTDGHGGGEAVFPLGEIDASTGLLAIKRPATDGDLTPIQFVGLPADNTDPLFNRTMLHEIRLMMDPDDWQTIVDDPERTDYFPADVVFQGVMYRQVGIRPRGKSSRIPGFPQPNVQIKFDHYVPGQRFFGLQSIKLKSWASADFTLMHDTLAMEMFRTQGVPAPRDGYSRFYVNDDYKGVYLIVESPNKDFLGRWFTNRDGNLYRIRSSDDAFEYVGPNLQDYIPYPFEPKNDHSDGTDILNLIRVLNNTPPGEMRRELERILNLENILNYVAIEMVLPDNNGLIGWFEGECFTNNTYWYHDPTSDKFHALSNDLDGAFEDVNRGLMHCWDRLTFNRWMLSDSSWRTDFTERIRRLINGPFNARLVLRNIDQVRLLIKNGVYEDSLKPFSNQEWEQYIQDLKDYVRQRVELVRQRLN